jgi:threonine dehydratase
VLSGALDAAARVDGPVVAIISGGNMDAARLAEFAAQVKG